MWPNPFAVLGTLISLALTPNQDFCPGYYCSNTLSGLNCQQINKPLLEQLIIKDNPKLLESANCQPDNRTELPTKDLVVWLNYKDTKIFELQNSYFANYTNLNVLMMNNNSLQMIQSQAFKGLSHLEFLHLQNNFIRHLPPNVFHPLENIAWIDLSNNIIGYLPENAFSSDTKLKGLDLRKNRFYRIDILAGSPIRSIDNFLLSDCNKLEEVNIEIDVLNITLENSGVDYLKMSGRVQSIRAENASVYALDLNGATLNGSFLSDILCRVQSVKWLGLSSTSLDTIQLSSSDLYNDCQLPYLRYLTVSNNNIESLPMGSPLFGSQLVTLDLSYNKLQNVPLETLKEAHSLQSLNLDGNRLTSFEYESAYDKFKNLKTLTVRENNFNVTFYNALAKYVNKRLGKGEQQAPKEKTVPEEQKAPEVGKQPKDLDVPKVEDLPKDQNATKLGDLPNCQKPPEVERGPKDQKAQNKGNEQKDQNIWIWITVPIIVVLLVALVWQVMRNRGRD